MSLDDNVWAFYLQLHNIQDILFAPETSVEELFLLKVLIEEYLVRHVAYFPDDHLKNKHHHLVHYPQLIHEVGPLHQLWCMGFESKHQRAEVVLNMRCNLKNVLLAIATR